MKPRKQDAKSRKPVSGKAARDQTAEVAVFINLGLERHQAGELDWARQYYEMALAIEPHHAEVLQLLATALTNLGEADAAILRFREALELDRSNEAVLLNFAIALNQKGNKLKAIGQFGDALAYYQEAIQRSPGFADPYNGLGNTLCSLGRTEESFSYYQSAIARKPYYSEALCNYGIALHRLGRYQEAITNYNRALAIRPESVEALRNRANSKLALGETDDALAGFNQALQINPSDSLSYLGRGSALASVGRHIEALASFAEALSINPDNADAQGAKASALISLGRTDEALQAFREAIRLQPEDPETHLLAARAFLEFGQFEDAALTLSMALELAPQNADLHYEYAVAMHRLGRYQEAISAFDQTMLADPNHPMARHTCAQIHLLLGDFETGWNLYEHRLEVQSNWPTRLWNLTPTWQGQAAHGKQRLLIRSEQGFGDHIQFCRYLLLVERLGFDIILEVPNRLTRLLASLPVKQIEFVAPGDPTLGADYQCWLMSLPGIFKTREETIPSAVPYLTADPQKINQWQKRLGPSEMLRVGLVWSGRAEHLNDKYRSIPLEDLMPLFQLPVEFHSIQVEYRPSDLEALSRIPNLHQHQDQIEDFSDSAALIQCLDLVISVDTSIAHLTGALAKPLWLIVASTPDFRWLLDREDSPWYPTARIWRQDRGTDWAPLIQRLTKALADWQKPSTMS